MIRKVLKELYTEPISFDIGNYSFFFEASQSLGSCFSFISNYIDFNNF